MTLEDVDTEDYIILSDEYANTIKLDKIDDNSMCAESGQIEASEQNKSNNDSAGSESSRIDTGESLAKFPDISLIDIRRIAKYGGNYDECILDAWMHNLVKVIIDGSNPDINDMIAATPAKAIKYKENKSINIIWYQNDAYTHTSISIEYGKAANFKYIGPNINYTKLDKIDMSKKYLIDKPGHLLHGCKLHTSHDFVYDDGKIYNRLFIKLFIPD